MYVSVLGIEFGLLGMTADNHERELMYCEYIVRVNERYYRRMSVCVRKVCVMTDKKEVYFKTQMKW